MCPLGCHYLFALVAFRHYDDQVRQGRRRSWIRGSLILVALTTTGAFCTPSWADDVARVLGKSEDEAIRIVQNAADETLRAEDDVARFIIRNGDEVVETRPRLLSYLDDLKARVAQSDDFWQDVIYGVYCDASARARLGLEVTPQDVYGSAISNFGQEVADALANSGWVGFVANLIAAARSDDPDALQLVVAEFLYCVGRT
jgi:hypothetical protein